MLKVSLKLITMCSYNQTKADQTQSITTHVYFKLKIILLYPVLYTYLTILHPIYLYQTQSYLIKLDQTWSFFFAGCSGPKPIKPNHTQSLFFAGCSRPKPTKPNHIWSLFFAGCSRPKLIKPNHFSCRL